MREKFHLLVLAFLFSGLLLMQCGTEKKEVLLRLKFNDNQSLRWANNYKRHMEVFENDSLALVDNIQEESESVEDVIKVIDEKTARLKLTTYFDKKYPDKNDSTKTVSVKDSSIIEYIQDNRAVNLDIFPHDTVSIMELEYIKKIHEQIAPRYPDDPVSIGYKWTNNIKVMLKDGETKDAISNYTVRGFAREAGYDCIIIECNGNAIVPFQGERIGKKSGEKFFETRLDKRTMSGTAYIAYKEGFVVREDYSYELLGEGTRLLADKEIKIKITAKGSHSYNLIKASGI
jgi:hypothetical protein